MQRYFYIFLLSLLPVLGFAQKKTLIKILSFENLNVDPKQSVFYLRKPVFQHDNATLSCDSAVLYKESNVFEAFNNVHINQADTINIFSTRLHYDGNTKNAHLTDNVRMIDPQSVLTTNVLDYNLGTKIGTYTTGGKIVTKDVTLKSKNGYYFANSNDSYFRYNVDVVTPQVHIKSDTLRYNTLSKWTYFYGPTNIKGETDQLYTENGVYNTATEVAYFGKKNKYTSGTRTLTGDSLHYDGRKGFGKAVKNIVFRDSQDKIEMYGQLGYYYREQEQAIVTKQAYLGIEGDSVMVEGQKRADTLWMGADTLQTQMVLKSSLTLIPKIVVSADGEVGEEEAEQAEDIVETGVKGLVADSLVNKAGALEVKALDRSKAIQPDTLKQESKPPVKAAVQVKPSDSISLKPPDKKSIAADSSLNKSTLDTAKVRSIKAFHHVKIYKSNLQGRMDSLFYNSGDSTLRGFNNPILWSEHSQLTGDTLHIQLRNKKIYAAQMFKNAFVVNTPEDSLKFNQIKGKKMTALFKDGKMNTMYVDGNAESVAHNRDDKTKVYKESNQTVSSRLKFIFSDKNEVEQIIAINNVEGLFDTKPREDIFLKGFIWKPKERIQSKAEAIGRNLDDTPKKTKAAAKPAKVAAPPAKVPAVKPKPKAATLQGLKKL